MASLKLSQAQDGILRSTQEMDHYTRNGIDTFEDRSSPGNFPDEAPPDSPASSLVTVSEVDLTDEDTQDSIQQTLDEESESAEINHQPLQESFDGAVLKSAVNDYINLSNVPKKRKPLREEIHQNKEKISIDITNTKGPKRRRPLREEIHQNKEKNIISTSITYTKDKIIDLLKKFQDKHFGICILMAFIGVMALAFIMFNSFSELGNDSSPKNTLYYMVEEIRNQYPTQDKRDVGNLIRAINNVNKGNLLTDKVAVITILYSHRETAECLAKSAANFAVKVLRRNGNFVRLNGSLSNADFYLGNENFKKDIEDKGVLVVYDFHNLPPEKVRYFHGICDKHTPYIEDKAVYIILLELTKKQEEISKKFEKVESRMVELWSTLKSEIIKPLAVRLMDNVFIVQEEPNLYFC